MGLLEMVLTLVLVILVLQLFLSFIPGLDSRIVGIIILVVVLFWFFGAGGRGRFGWGPRGEAPGLGQQVPLSQL